MRCLQLHACTHIYQGWWECAGFFCHGKIPPLRRLKGLLVPGSESPRGSGGRNRDRFGISPDVQARVKASRKLDVIQTKS